MKHPPSFQDLWSRQLFSTKFYFNMEQLLKTCCYVPKVNKPVILMNTEHYDHKIQGDERFKSNMIANFNVSKVDVDTLDQSVNN